jgi:predicted glycosyltransferase
MTMTAVAQVKSVFGNVRPTSGLAQHTGRCIASPTRPKILLYSHDTFGLGNIRRSLLLGELLSAEYPRSAILLVTGSPMIHAFPLPERMDYVKLPCVDRVAAEQYAPRFLTDCDDEVRETRSAIVERSILGFRPDVVIVDKRAAGIDGELLPALEALRKQPNPPRLVLGIRDILDAPEKTSQVLRDNGSFDVMARYYDEVWIYGSPLVFDAVTEYQFPAPVAAKTRYCGYLRRAPVVRRPAGSAPRVLVTTGGGADGEKVIRAYLQGLQSLPLHQLETTVVFGPQIAARASTTLSEEFGRRDDVQFVDFEADMTRRYETADAVVSMAGYNTVCELLTAGVRAVLVPRSEPVQEQLIRARRLSARGCFTMVEPSQLTADTLMAAVQDALASAAPTTRSVDMEGLTRIRERVHRLLEGRVS